MMVEEMVTSTPMPSARRLTFLRRGAASNTPENFLNESNDDAERTERRRSVLNRTSATTGSAGTPVTNDSTNALSQDELKSQLATFYKLYQDNKINATNVWNLKVIDCLKQLVKSSSTNDVLKIAGSSLEVAGKVYGIRVDDLHSDALKLASHWARVFASKHKDDDNNDGNTEDAPGEEGQPKKKKQAKKRRFGLATNKQHILCSEFTQLTASGKKLPKLESDRFSVATDPKLSSSENLLTNRLRMNTAGASFSMWGTEKSWHYYGDSFDASVKQEDNKKFPLNLRSLEKYRLCPIDFRMDQWFPDESSVAPENLATTLDPLVVSAAGIPIAELDDSVHDALNDVGGSDSDDIEEENAVEQAPLYRTDLPFVVDFAPSESSSSLANMTNTSAIWRQSNLLQGPTHQWAGPEHWKYKGLKNNPLIYTGKENEKAKQSHTKKTGTKKEYEPLDLNHLRPPVDFSDLPPLKQTKKCINIDPAKLRLPLCLPDLTFKELMEDLNCLSRIPTTRVRPFTDNVNGESNRITASNAIDQPNATFPDNDDNHGGDDLADDIFDNAEPMDTDDERPASQDGETEVSGVADFIGDNLIDAPEMVEPVDLKYATKAKKTNMKKLKKDVWCVLTQQPEYDEAAKVIQTTFWEMAKLVELRHGTEDSSIPLIFVSLLHITNEQNLVLKQITTGNNFEISGPSP